MYERCVSEMEFRNILEGALRRDGKTIRKSKLSKSITEYISDNSTNYCLLEVLLVNFVKEISIKADWFSVHRVTGWVTTTQLEYDIF